MRAVTFFFKGNDLYFRGYSGKRMFPEGRFGYRILPMEFFRVKEELEEEGYEVITKFNTDFSLREELKGDFSLREYQEEALDKWYSNGNRGVIVLPTGAGKTFLALEAMRELMTTTLIVVPTLSLMHQWRAKISEYLGVIPGQLGGGKKEIKGITVSTYDSAHLNLRMIRDKFGLIVFDEVHHLPAPSYRTIALGSISPYRMGLTATLERSDELHEMIPRLVGEEVFRLSPDELKGYLADYEIKRIYVDLTEEERAEYEKLRDKYLSYLRSRNIKFRSGRDFEKLVLASGKDVKAREALIAHQKSRKIVFNAEGKLRALEKILKKHEKDQIIIFSEYTSLVEEIGERFLIPVITHRTRKEEREFILEGFSKGEITKIASGKVLDEGFDVQGARIGVVISGSGQRRQYIQRLGRLLRPMDGKRAILYEIVSRRTAEVSTAARRRRNWRSQ